MKIAIFGLGYVGFTAACCIASQGHEVVGVEVSEAKIDDINNGLPPFTEPGLAALMAKAQEAGRLSATRDPVTALQNADLAIVCVGTPSGPEGGHDMRYIVEVTRQIARTLRSLAPPQITVTYRSTMRPGTMRRLIAPLFDRALPDGHPTQVELVYNPEFLREAQAIHDYFHPPKIVVGTADGQPSPVMEALHQDMEGPQFITPFEEAELTKFVDNSWHATKVSFANELGRMCQIMGISAQQMYEVFVADTKLNISPHYLRPGGAFGGSCLPKDVRALQSIANDVGAHFHLVDSLLRSNEAHKNHQFDQAYRALNGGRSVLLVGLAFKAGTDDLRESPNVDLARKLLNAGVDLRVFDPVLDPCKLRGQNLGYVYANLPTIDQLLIDQAGAEAGAWDLVIVTNGTGAQLDLRGHEVLELSQIA